MFEDKAYALYHRCLAEGVFVHSMCVTFESEFAVRREHIFDVEVSEERSICYVIIAIAEVTIDNELVNWLQREDSLIFLRSVSAFSISTDIKAHREDIGYT